MTIYTPYTYLIGWSTLNKWYYGARWGKNCNPSDLWVTYFTSSKVVKKIRQTHGDPDVIKIRKTFTDGERARIWESRVLRKMSAVEDERFLNRNYGDGTFYATPDTIAKLLSYNIGREISAETRLKQSVAGKGRGKSESHRQKISQAHKGKQHSQQRRDKLSASRKLLSNPQTADRLNNGEKFHCAQCNKWMSKGNFVRWHQHDKYKDNDETRISYETRQKISNAKKGSVSWNRGKTGLYSASTETKALMSQQRIGLLWYNDGNINYRLKPDDIRVKSLTKGILK